MISYSEITSQDECHWLYLWFANIGLNNSLMPPGKQAIAWVNVDQDRNYAHIHFQIHFIEYIFCYQWGYINTFSQNGILRL